MSIFQLAIPILLPLFQLINAEYYYSHWCGGSLTYLDDHSCQKKFPSSYNRDWQCPVEVLSSPPAGYSLDSTLDAVSVDTSTLGSIVTSGANLCLILTKRVKADESSEVRLYNKYYCAGNASATEKWETWSSSKIFAMANAAGHLRQSESSCAAGSFGLDSSTTGSKGATKLGDLATIVCSYDHTAGYSSNSLSSYFHDLVRMPGET